MSRLRLARQLAEVTGKNVAQALRFIRDVGMDNARKAVRAAENNTTWKVPATVGAGGGVALTWRQQNVELARAEADQEEAEAEQSRDATETLQLLLESDDLPPEVRRQLMEEIAPDVGGDEDDDEDDDDERGGLSKILDELFGDGGLGGSMTQTVILLVVVLVVLNWALSQTSQIGTPSVSAGGVR